MSKKNLLQPTNDYVFQKIFGAKGNENITKGFIEAITDEQYKSVQIQSSVPTQRALKDDKMGILDIKVSADDDIELNIEMQVAKYEFMPERILWYWSNLYSKSINSGEDYSKVKKTIAILIADFDLSRLKNIKKYHTSWHIKEDKFSEIILTEKLEIHIIELKKLEVNNNHNIKYKKLVKWLNFISNPNGMGVYGMEEDEDIKAARKVLEEMSQDEKEREKAYYREKYIRDWNARVNEGFEQGVEKGIKQGRKEGIKQEKIKVIQNLLKNRIDINVISEVTGLPISEIEKIIQI